MATQEPNVYAGLSVVVGGLMHARPRFFAKVMGELLFWVGEDKMLFGSDYGDLGAEVADRGPRRLGHARRRRVLATSRAWTTSGKKKILGLNAAKLYGIEVPAELRCRRRRRRAGRRRTRSSSRRRRDARGPESSRRSATVYDPELDEPITTLGFVGSVRRDRRRRRRRAPAAADAAVRAELRVPDGRRRARRGLAACRGVGAVDVVLDDHYTGDEINAAVDAAAAFADAFPGETARRAGRAARAVPAQGAARAPGSRLLERRRAAGARSGDLHGPDARARAASCAARSASTRPTTPRPFVTGDGAPVSADDRRFRRMASLTALSLGDQRRHVPRSAAGSHTEEEVAA